MLVSHCTVTSPLEQPFLFPAWIFGICTLKSPRPKILLHDSPGEETVPRASHNESVRGDAKDIDTQHVSVYEEAFK